MTTKQKLKTDLKFVKSREDEFIKCRSMRHAWNVWKVGVASEVMDPDQIVMGYSGAMVRILRCLRCQMFRFDFMTNGGRRPAQLQGQDSYRIFYRRYEYPEGYVWSTSDGVERPEQRHYHQEFFRRHRA